MTYRILVTGSRDWTDWDALGQALKVHYSNRPYWDDAVFVHGDCPDGVDAATEVLCGYLDLKTEKHNANGFDSFKDRNQHMVSIGADICLAFATSWASGTGQTARMARKADIHTIDYGVDTRIEAR